MTQHLPNQIEIVAELAQGFEGNPELARLLVKAAAAAGADAAKFQLVYADELATPDYKYYDLFKTLEMPDAVWEGLATQARTANTKLYLDIFGKRSLELAESIGVQCVKLHGTDIANAGFLADVAKSKIPRIMLGAGGAHKAEIEKALDILAGKDLVLLLGYQGYPTPTETNQIARVRWFADLWASAHSKVQIGFADHADPEDGTRFALAATAVGAGSTVIEKHLTLGRNMKLEDHESALNPDEFAEFTTIVRNCAAAFGAVRDAADFGMSEEEYGYRKMIRRHVIAAQHLPAGTILAPEHVMLKRAGADDVLTDIEDVYGRKLAQPVAENAPVQAADLESTK